MAHPAWLQEFAAMSNFPQTSLSSCSDRGISCLALWLKAFCHCRLLSTLFAQTIFPRLQRVTSMSTTLRLYLQEGR